MDGDPEASARALFKVVDALRDRRRAVHLADAGPLPGRVTPGLHRESLGSERAPVQEVRRRETSRTGPLVTKYASLGT
jgi:hypothetical protein